MTLLRAAFLIIVFAVGPVSEAASWGASGHSIIAEIAQRRLDPQAARRIRELLGDNVSLASVASWADDLTMSRPDTANWHFVNIPYDAASYDPERDCKATARGDCVINAIARARALLADRKASRQQRVEALMLLIHFIGDVHQPLHAANRNDAGGSQLGVTFFDRPMSLHAVWDYGIIERRTFDWGEYVRYLEQCWLRGKDIDALQRGTPVDWALEAHRAAVDVAYSVPEDLKLGLPYYQKSVPIVDRQLALAGVRLAHVLNQALGYPGSLTADRQHTKRSIARRSPRQETGRRAASKGPIAAFPSPLGDVDCARGVLEQLGDRPGVLGIDAHPDADRNR
jgi:nuclease S1